METKQAIEVDFRELADGTLLETIEDPDHPSKSLLAMLTRSKRLSKITARG